MESVSEVISHELLNLLYGALIGTVAFFLKRTVSMLDKMEARAEKHERRLMRLEIHTGVSERHHHNEE